MVTRRENRWSLQRPAQQSSQTPAAVHVPGDSSSQQDPQAPGKLPRAHARSHSWLSSLLKPSASSKRRSKEPEPRPSLRPLAHTPPAAAGEARAPAPAAAHPRRTSSVSRKPAPKITLVDLEAQPPQHATLGWPVTNQNLLRSASMPIHLSLKPLPLAAEDEKARLAAWNWDAPGDVRPAEPISPASPTKIRHEQTEAISIGRKELLGQERRLSGETALDGSPSRRVSQVSDNSADIAFSGPVLYNPPPFLPTFVAGDAAAAELAKLGDRTSRRGRALSPIYEGDSGRCISSRASVRDDPADSPAILHPVPTARPILHVDPAHTAVRKLSASSASIYSCSPDPERDEQDAQSSLAPEAPMAEYTLSLGGLAISGVHGYELSPSAPASPRRSVSGRRVHAAGHSPSIGQAAAIALATKPSFSRYRFPSRVDQSPPSPSPTPSPPSSVIIHDTGRLAPLLDPQEGPLPLEETDAPPSSSTAATSTFEAQGQGELKPSETLVSLAGSEVSGRWRSGWTLESPVRERSPEMRGPLTLPAEESDAREGETEPSLSAAVGPPLEPPASLVRSSVDVPSTKERSSPVSLAQPSSPTEPSPTPRVPRTLSTTSSALAVSRKKSKVLPDIPDSASIWSGDDHIEVYCQRELVRRHHGRTERVVLERTLMYEEGELVPPGCSAVAV